MHQQIEDFDTPWQPTAVTYPEPERVWDCQNGHWIDNPRCYAEVIADPKDDTVPEATVQLWSVCHKLQQLSPGDIEPAAVQSLRRGVFDVIRELQRLS